MSEPYWLTLGRELQAIAQIGLTFCKDPFDRQRYERIRELAASVIAQNSRVGETRAPRLFQSSDGLRNTQGGRTRGGLSRRLRALGARGERWLVDAAGRLGGRE